MARRPRRLIPLLALASLLAPGAPAAAAGPRATAAALQREMRLAGPAAGGFALDLDGGAVLLSSQADVARIPASVEKLYTTATALLRYGPDGTLATTALGERALGEDGTLEGNLYLRGGGDPTFDSAAASRLAGRLEAAGLRRVTGRVMGDESIFDGRRGPPSSHHRTSRWVGPLSGLSFERGRTGRRRPYFQLSPALFAAQAFERALRRRGVRFGARAGTGATPVDAVTLAEERSPTMAAIVRRTNVPSDNFLAESLLKGLGAEYGASGSTASGAEVVRRTLRGLGITARVVDGSGLSRSNRTSPRAVATLLSRLAADPAGPALDASLAVAGRTGTLKRRMRGTAAQDRCRAKTGTLISVSALAGYCTTTGGARVAFAFLMNSTGWSSARWRQDRMTAALARYEPAR
jgi:D-alanyl-D-alanine carboxypeptidase/D-alanyl-D-alanine-endopeptidase (penicillin-binding protein 4)